MPLYCGGGCSGEGASAEERAGYWRWGSPGACGPFAPLPLLGGGAPPAPAGCCSVPLPQLPSAAKGEKRQVSIDRNIFLLYMMQLEK